MKLLFIKLKLIGDALILTGTLREVKRAYPDAEIHVVVRKGTEGILAGCPEITAIHTTGDKSGGKIARLRRELGLILRLRAEKFDRAFELGDGDRGRIMALCSGASSRFANASAIQSAFWKRMFRGSPEVMRDGKHAALWDFEVVRAALPKLPEDAVPAPVFDREKSDFSWIGKIPPGVAPVFIHPVASRPGKLWSVDGWVSVVRAALAEGRPVILSSGPAAHETELCRSIAGAIKDPRVFLTEGKLDWPQVAGALYRSAAYVGTDTAAMHLAAACDIPVVALFAHPPESRPELWRPLCRESRILMTGSPQEPLSTLEPGRVVAAMREVLAESGTAHSRQPSL